MRKKISLIGSGHIGSTLGLYLAQEELGDIFLLDVMEGVPQGISLDLLHSTPLFKTDSKIIGTQNYADTKNSDIYIVSAGSARKPGMSRDDLLKINAQVIKTVGENIKKYSPEALVIVITNPLDTMVQYMKEVTGVPKNRVIGMAGVLDSARFRAFVAQEIGISVEDVSALVLGGHGDTMVPLVRYCTVNGIPVTNFISPEKLKSIVERVKKAGEEIVNLLKTGSAYYSPAASACEMVKAILKDKKRILPCSAFLEGEYGIKGYYLGVPVLLGAGGIEKVIELELTDEEKTALRKSADSCVANIETLRKVTAA